MFPTSTAPVAAGIRRRSNGPSSRRGAATLCIVAAVILGACDDLPTLTPSHASANLEIAAPPGGATLGEIIPGQYIVSLRPDVADVPGLARRLVAERGGALGMTYTTALTGFAATLPEQAAAALARVPEVTSVEPDRRVHVQNVQTNPPWGLDRIDQAALPLNGSYSYAATGAGVNVYIIDSGIRSTHAEFAGRASAAYTVINDGMGTDDCFGHGTHVAGIVAGATVGVAKGARVYAVRVVDCAGGGTVSGIIAAVDWVTANHARPAVANMSLGTAVSSALNQAIQNSINAGVTYVVSAGNSRTNACDYSPASAPGAITVAATSSDDYRASFSNLGSCVDIFAPGVDIPSAGNRGDRSIVTMSGTSMASPHVAGAAALYLERNPSATPGTVASALLGAATKGVVQDAGSGSPNLLLLAPSAGSAPAPTPIDSPPVATFGERCSRTGCAFDAGASTPSGRIVTYAWNFGDGSPAVATNTATITHAYAARGDYVVALTVTDDAARTATTQHVISVKRGSGQ